jgi:metal-responsive CopG/Arc/MetJ family transcriptional regulator
MSDKSKTHYTDRLSVHITPAMSNRLDQIAMMRDEAKAEVVRSALRTYLDGQEDLLGSRKHFTKMFQRRMTYLERLTTIMLWLNVQMMQILMEEQHQESYNLMELLSDVIVSGLDTEDGIYTLIETAGHQKRKPPAT